MADQYYNGDGRYYPPYNTEPNPYAQPQGMAAQGINPYTYEGQYAYGAPYGGYVPQYEAPYQPYPVYGNDYGAAQSPYGRLYGQQPAYQAQQPYPYTVPDRGSYAAPQQAYTPAYEQPYAAPVQPTYGSYEPAPYLPAYNPSPWQEPVPRYTDPQPVYDPRMMPAQQPVQQSAAPVQAQQPVYTPTYYPEAHALPPVAPVEAFVPPRVLPYMQQEHKSAQAPAAQPLPLQEESSAPLPSVEQEAAPAPTESPVFEMPAETPVAAVTAQEEEPALAEVPAEETAPVLTEALQPVEEPVSEDGTKVFSFGEFAGSFEPAAQPVLDFAAEPVVLEEVQPETLEPVEAPAAEELSAQPAEFLVESAEGMDPFAADVPTMEEGVFEEVFSQVTQENDPGLALQNTQEVSRVAEELSSSILMNSYRSIFTDNNLAAIRQEICLQARNVTADLFLMRDGGRPYRMFDDVQVTVRSGACVAVVADIGLAAYALLKKLGEMSDAYSEDVSVEASKAGFEREILYIGSDSMLPDDITVMQFLLMVTRRSEEKAKARAQRFSVLLGQMGLGAVENENTKNLSRFRRVMVLLLAAALNSEVGCVLLNDPLLEMPQEDDLVARRVFAFLKDAGKGMMLASCDSALMASVANRVLALRDGRVVFDDTFRRFIDRNCLGIFSFTSADADAAVSYFVEKHPEVSALSNGNLVYLMRRRDDDIDLEKLVKGALTHGADPHSLVLDEKSFDIACREVLKGI